MRWTFISGQTERSTVMLVLQTNTGTKKQLVKPSRSAQLYLQCFDEHFNVEISETQRDPKHGREHDDPQHGTQPHLENPKYHMPACRLHFSPGSSQWWSTLGSADLHRGGTSMSLYFSTVCKESEGLVPACSGVSSCVASYKLIITI